jgi:hypothetical protein
MGQTNDFNNSMFHPMVFPFIGWFLAGAALVAVVGGIDETSTSGIQMIRPIQSAPHWKDDSSVPTERWIKTSIRED